MEEDTIAKNRERIQSGNFSVKLLENLKTYLARLFSDLIRNLKIITWEVEVKNPVFPKDPIDYSGQLQDLLLAIKALPEPKDVDLSEITETLRNLLDKQFPEQKHYDGSNVVEQIKMLETAIQGLPKAYPKSKDIDLSPLEKPLKELVEILKPKPMPKGQKVKEIKIPEFISEELVYNEDEELVKVIQHYDTHDTIEEKEIKETNGITSCIWTTREVKK